MECGGGNLALPLAMGGHRVVACDYSAAMLKRLRQFADGAGVGENLTVEQVSWADDWEDLPTVDVFIASRTLRTHDQMCIRDRPSACRRQRDRGHFYRTAGR